MTSDLAEHRLYGTPGAERMYQDEATAIEVALDDRFDPEDRTPIVIEEWSVCGTRSMFPPVDVIIERLIEDAADDATEGWFEDASVAGRHPDVVAAVENAVTLLAAKIGYLMADKMVAEHQVTFADDGEVLFDGLPAFPKAKRP
jgi:hypothetical protein